MHKRRNYLINKKFQFGFAAKFAAMLVLESLLIIWLFSVLTGDTVTTGYQNAILTVDNTRQFFLFPFILMTLVIVLAICLAGMVVFTLLSHRVAGPMYRFEQVLKKIQGGDLTEQFSLRKTDQLTGVQGELNTAVSSLENRIEQMKALIKEAQKEDNIDTIKEKIRLLQKELEFFKVSSDQHDA